MLLSQQPWQLAIGDQRQLDSKIEVHQMMKWHNKRSYRREKGDDMTHEKKEGEMYLTGKKAKAGQK